MYIFIRMSVLIKGVNSIYVPGSIKLQKCRVGLPEFNRGHVILGEEVPDLM